MDHWMFRIRSPSFGLSVC